MARSYTSAVHSANSTTAPRGANGTVGARIRPFFFLIIPHEVKRSRGGEPRLSAVEGLPLNTSFIPEPKLQFHSIASTAVLRAHKRAQREQSNELPSPHAGSHVTSH